jgi:hypothetical protein
MVAEDAEGRITSSKRASLAALLPEAFRLEARTPRRPKRRAKALPQ